MRYKLLGRSGLRVSEVCLGTMMMSTESPSSAGPEESRRILEAFADRGGNYFDTANEVYSGGLSERILGDFVASERHRYVVTTKYTNTLYSAFDPSIRDHPNAGGNHKKSMVHSVEGSLKRLGVDYIDLLWIHFWEYSTDIVDVMRNVNDLVQQGKVLHFGLCNTPAWVVARGQTVAEQRGWEPISALQYQYNLVSRDLEFEIIPCAPRPRNQHERLLAAGRRLPDRQVHAWRQHREPTLRQRVLQTTDLPVRRESVRHRPQGGRDRRPPRNQLGRSGTGMGSRPRRDPDDRGPEGFPDRGQPAISVTHPA